MYHKVKICQYVNKWFGCKRLERKKFSIGLSFVARFKLFVSCEIEETERALKPVKQSGVVRHPGVHPMSFKAAKSF